MYESISEPEALYVVKLYMQKIWNRKLHIYLGLFLLTFIWLFSVSGLFLNNPEWSIASYWSDREITIFRQEIEPPAADGDLAVAHDLMHQLDIRGEVYQTGRNLENDGFTCQVRRPGRIFNIEANFAEGITVVEDIRLNTTGVINMLHTFTGPGDGNGKKRNWLLTKIWSFSMDAVSAGLILLIISGLYMWYCLNRNRTAGLIALLLGTTCCWFFLFAAARLL